MSWATVIDLELDGLPGAIATYLLREPAPLLVDPGPSTTLPRLRRRLEEAGVRLRDLRHVLLTHVHLDHAGVTGHLVREAPGLTVHLHPDGARHLVDPDRLVASTRRTFGPLHDRLWGEVLPVPEGRIRPAEGGGEVVAGIRALPTPGHIGHHLAYFREETGTLFSGDALGIIPAPGAPVHPPTPPPSFDGEAWLATLDALRGLPVRELAVAHFGIHGDFEGRRRQLGERIRRLLARVEEALARGQEADGDRYEEEVRAEQARFLPPDRVDRYFDIFRARTDWEGVRYFLARRR